MLTPQPVMLRDTEACVLVVDLQERLLPHIDRRQEVEACAGGLVEMAGLFGMPTLASVQYVRGLGATVASVAQRLDAAGATILEKASFSVGDDDACMGWLDRAGRRQVIVAGIEAHVCVAQTVLQLLGRGYQPFVLVDAVSSRRAIDREQALARMRAAGAVVTTTEAVMFELCRISGTPRFKQLLAIVKALDVHREETVPA